MCLCVCFVDLEIVPKALPHSHTSCRHKEKEEEEGEESQREKKGRRREQEATFRKGSGKVKKKICSYTRGGIVYGNHTACGVHSIHHSFIRDV